MATNGLSPHGRGKLTAQRLQGPLPRSIPARAGETVAHTARPQSTGVYPRTGGGNSSWLVVVVPF